MKVDELLIAATPNFWVLITDWMTEKLGKALILKAYTYRIAWLNAKYKVVYTKITYSRFVRILNLTRPSPMRVKLVAPEILHLASDCIQITDRWGPSGAASLTQHSTWTPTPKDSEKRGRRATGSSRSHAECRRQRRGYSVSHNSGPVSARLRVLDVHFVNFLQDHMARQGHRGLLRRTGVVKKITCPNCHNGGIRVKNTSSRTTRRVLNPF